MEESVERRERLKAIRSDAPNASPLPTNTLFNPFAPQSTQTSSPPPPNPRFDFYTDPMAAYSGQKRKILHTPPSNTTSPFLQPPPSSLPGPGNLDMTTSPSQQIQNSFSPGQRRFDARPPYHGSSSLRSPSAMANQFPGHQEYPRGSCNTPFLGYQGTPQVSCGTSFPGHQEFPRGSCNSPFLGYQGTPNASCGTPFPGPQGPYPGSCNSSLPRPQGSPGARNSPYSGHQGTPPGARNIPFSRHQATPPGARNSPYSGHQVTPPGAWNMSGGTTDLGYSSNQSGVGGYPSRGYGRGGSPSPNSGRGIGHWYNNGPSPGSGRGGGRGRGFHGSISARERPDLFYSKSMVDDPWKNLIPGVTKPWLPKSLTVKKDTTSGASSRFSSGLSLAEELAACVEELEGDGNDLSSGL